MICTVEFSTATDLTNHAFLAHNAAPLNLRVDLFVLRASLTSKEWLLALAALMEAAVLHVVLVIELRPFVARAVLLSGSFDLLIDNHVNCSLLNYDKFECFGD